MRLVEDWRDAWRWLSVRAMVLALALQAAWNMLDDAQRESLPDWLVSVLTGGILLFGVAGRLVDQKKANDPAYRAGGAD